MGCSRGGCRCGDRRWLAFLQYERQPNDHGEQHLANDDQQLNDRTGRVSGPRTRTDHHTGSGDANPEAVTFKPPNDFLNPASAGFFFARS